MLKSILPAVLVLLVLSCNNAGNEESSSAGQVETPVIPEAPMVPYTIVNTYPHDTAAFTQGFEFHDGTLLESTGLEGRSSLRKVDLASGKPKELKHLDDKLFGEGITVLNDTLYQLTWQNHKVLLYNPVSFKPLGELNWSNEGWGITNDGKSLFISDGSDKIYVVKPGTLKLERVISVTDHLGPLNNLNELEFINGSIYANRIEYNYIVKIDPSNGHVTGKLDFTDILKKYSKMDLSYLENNPHGAVLNGIAWEPSKKKMYITGKLWPLVFELQVEP
ncbi:MAG TPA: glutaminyl-peptide cyclotransferase [Chitinophagaceae bacterium]|nr:glutaminyl-peptide cyclotransferase [Chitinophagaceae bacterium]